MKNIRLLSLVGFAVLALLVIKTLGLLLNEAGDLSGQKVAVAQNQGKIPSPTAIQKDKLNNSNQVVSEPLAIKQLLPRTKRQKQKQATNPENNTIKNTENVKADLTDNNTLYQGSVFDENFVNGAVPPQLSIIPKDFILNENTVDTLVTGAVGEEDKENKQAQNQQQAQTEAENNEQATGTEKAQPANIDPAKQLKAGPVNKPTKSEFEVLRSLSDRRKQLEARERQLDLQKNLLKAAEKRVTSRISELRSIEERIRSALKKQEEVQSAQYGRLVTIYSKMKPGDAARVFNRLDINILLGLVQRIKPKAMSPIMAAMDPAQVERLTLEMASKAEDAKAGNSTLPKINSN
ncbi:MAG: hypothetical protein AAF228_00890 [Pseudomonadota bacterium]